MEKQVLVTLTAPSAAGKSYLFNYIRDVAKLPCLISTTTRMPRVGEVDGLDYHFISQEESIRLEQEEMFAELAIYNGVRYGVTHEEFHHKLSQGVAFLIVEPSGIEHYAAPAIEVGALHVKAYVSIDPAIRIQRFLERSRKDMERAVTLNWIEDNNYSGLKHAVINAQNVALTRLQQMLTTETQWFQMCDWDVVLDGDADPAVNLAAIQHVVEKARLKSR